jgi:hypothetical protein
MGNGLIEQRQRIAHRAFRGAGDDAERFGLDLDALLRCDIRKMLAISTSASTRRRSKRW